MEKENIHVPIDLVAEILLRLPPKSITRLKCVCRQWNNFIKSPNFIKSHFHNPKNPNRLLAVSTSRTQINLFEGFESVPQSIPNPVTPSTIEDFIGPVNGLYLITFVVYPYVSVCCQAVWNPSTSEFRELPCQSLQDPIQRSQRSVRLFGFGSVQEDVRVVFIREHFVNNYNDYSYSVVIYSLARDSWNENEMRIDLPMSSFFKDRCSMKVMATHFNGGCYWLYEEEGRGVQFLLFDLINEEFREVNLPPECGNMEFGCICTRDNKSLVLFVESFGDDQGIQMWEMMEEGQWLKLLSLKPCSFCLDLVPLFWTEDEIIIQTRTTKALVMYNIYSEEFRDLDVNKSAYLLNYKDSFTSVRGPRGNINQEIFQMRASRFARAHDL